VTTRTTLPRPTERIRLGRSAVETSPYCLGWVVDPDTVLAAYDAGVSFFFLPTDFHLGLYRHAIEGLRRLLARGGDIRDRIVVGGVGYIEKPSFFPNTFQELLWLVPELERIDVGVAGAVDDASAGRVEQVAKLRDRAHLGMRAAGASFHARNAARDAIVGGAIDIAFIRYNPLHAGARDDLFPAIAADRTVTVFNFVNGAGYLDDVAWAAQGLGADYWRPGLADYYRFPLSRPEIDGLLVAPKIPAHVARITEAAEAGPLSEQEQEHMIDLALLAAGEATLTET
jgi:hypothetical protein